MAAARARKKTTDDAELAAAVRPCPSRIASPGSVDRTVCSILAPLECEEKTLRAFVCSFLLLSLAVFRFVCTQTLVRIDNQQQQQQAATRPPRSGPRSWLELISSNFGFFRPHAVTSGRWWPAFSRATAAQNTPHPRLLFAFCLPFHPASNNNNNNNNKQHSAAHHHVEVSGRSLGRSELP